jgi:hypothetical protein
MTWMKDLDVYKPYSDSLYFSSASLARQTEKLCDNLLGEKEAASLACAMNEAAGKLRGREGCA